jgi:hypothetical protein
VQAKAYADACDTLVSVEVGGDIEAAQQIKYVKNFFLLIGPFAIKLMYTNTIPEKKELCRYHVTKKKKI